MQKIKTLHPATSFIRFRGEDGFTIEYTKRLVQKGVEVDAVAPLDSALGKGFEVVDGVRIHRFRYFFPRSLQKVAYGGGIALNLSKSLLARLQFPLFMASFFFKSAANVKGKDLIHAEWVPSGLIGVILKKVTGKPVVLWIHEMNYAGFAKRIAKFVLENSDFVMFNSSYTMKIAEKFAKMKDYAIVPPGVDEGIFRPVRKKAARKRLGLPKESKIVFAVGRMVEKKGFRHLVEAMPLLKTKNVLCIIGGTGPDAEMLKSLAQSKGLEKRVLFPGWIKNEELHLWMNATDAVAVPSVVDSRNDTETLGIVAIEAIACGRPTVVSNVGGLPDVVINGFNGFVAKQKNPDDLAVKIDAALSEKAGGKIEKNARKHAVENFSWNSTVERTVEIYQKVLNRGK